MPPALLDHVSRLFTPVLAALAGEEGVWIAGGAVRDLLLDRRPRELDLVVEGDAPAVARRAAERLGGEVVVHDRFGTATVHAPGAVFDLAGARREAYARPGALPDVALGATLQEDLARRDFSVNALALRLSDGELAAWPGAREDLEAGVLRVLHDRSFHDDPTRLLRLARYAGRLGFAPDPRTEALAAEAVADGAFATVSGERLGAELRLLAREPQPAALQALGRWSGGAALLPGFAVDAPLLERALALRPADARADLIALATALRAPGPAAPPEAAATVGAAEAAEAAATVGAAEAAEPAATVGRRGAAEPAARLRALGFPAADAAAVVAAATIPPPSGRPSAVDAVLGRLPVEAAVVAAAAGSDAARDWLERARHLHLDIGGEDLLAAGLSGPAVGHALRVARAALLDGEAPGHEAQLAAALRA